MAKKEIPKLAVQSRDRLGKRYSARLRKSGRLPAVIYGRAKDPAHVTVDGKEMTILLHKNTHLLEVVQGAAAEPCLIKDVQWDHLGAEIIHIDLARVDLTSRVRVDVQLVLTGEAVGLKETGTILEQFFSEIEVECLATEIPEVVKIDVSHLNVGDSVTAGELKLPEGVVTTLGKETILAAVHVVAEVVEPEPTEAAAGAEPEVIGKKVEEGAEGDAAAAPAAKGEKKEEKKK